MNPFTALMTPFLVSTFPNLEASKVSNNTPRISLSGFFNSRCFVFLASSINAPEFSGAFMILII